MSIISNVDEYNFVGLYILLSHKTLKLIIYGRLDEGLFTSLLKKIKNIKKMNSPFNIKKTIRLYRYITYIVISAFFVLEDPITSLGRKAFIIS